MTSLFCRMRPEKSSRIWTGCTLDSPSEIIFNEAGEYSQTMHQVIQNEFHKAGMRICGKPYLPPKIIFWNLRGDTVGFPVSQNTPNTHMLSGFSPSLLKLLLSGENIANGVVTPADTLRAALDDERYDSIRTIVGEHLTMTV